jgi:ABC-type methionine transport system permease subunit
MAQGHNVSSIDVKAADAAPDPDDSADWLDNRVTLAAAKTSISPAIAATVTNLVRTKLSDGLVSAGGLGKIATELLSLIEQDDENAIK